MSDGEKENPLGLTREEMDAISDKAYAKSEEMFKEAVEGAASHKEFLTNLAYLQILGSHILAGLAFNTFKQNSERVALKDLLDLVFTGIRRELTYITQAYENGETTKFTKSVENK